MLQQTIGTSQNEENRLDEAGIPPIQLHHIGGNVVTDPKRTLNFYLFLFSCL